MRKSSLSRLSISGAPQRIQESPRRKRASSKERQKSGAFGFGTQSQPGRSSLNNGSRSSVGVNKFSTALKPKGAAGSSRTSGIGVRGRTDVPKDPRPLNDKKYVHGLIKRLLEFLVTNNYPHATSEKLLQAPSSKEFFKIFEFIYSQLSPCYKMGGKMEEEVPKLLRILGYPFTISKMHLFSVGSPHVWPNLVGALTWLIDIIQAADHVSNEVGIDAVIFHDDEEDSQDLKLFFDYAEKGYKLFMEGFDDHEMLDAELQAVLAQKYNQGDVDKLQEENSRMVQELQMHQEKEEQLSQLEERVHSERQDLLRLQKHTQELQQHKKVLAAKVKSLDEDCAVLHAEVQSEKHQLEKVQEIYDQQEMTAADVERVKDEQDQLKRRIQELEQQEEMIDEDIYKLNIETAKISDKVAAEVASYNRLANELKLVPSSAENANGQDYSLLNQHNANIPHKFEYVIKPKLMQMKKQCAEEIRQSTKQKYQQTYQLENLQESIDQLKDKLKQKKLELARLEADIDSLKQLSQKEHRSNSSEKSRMDELREQYEGKIKNAEESLATLGLDYVKAQKEFEGKKAETDKRLCELEEEKKKTYEEVECHKQSLKAQLTKYVEYMRKVDQEMKVRVARAEQEAARREKWLEVKRQEVAALTQQN